MTTNEQHLNLVIAACQAKRAADMQKLFSLIVAAFSFGSGCAFVSCMQMMSGSSALKNSSIPLPMQALIPFTFQVIIFMSLKSDEQPVSRVLSWTIIFLGPMLP